MVQMNNKAKVELIKKMAAEDPPIPAPAGTPAARTPSFSFPATAPGSDFVGPTQGGPTPASPVVNDRGVKQMQSDLVNLARSVISEMNTAALQAQPGQTEATPEQKEAGGRTSFNDFIAQHYMRQSDVPGVEFSPDPKHTGLGQKDPTQATRMNVVMDTMRRVGNPKGGEFAVDGKWGPRTNAALHNAYAYAYALLKMSKDFGYTPRTFDDARLQQLQELISHVPVGEENKINPQEKEQLAEEAIPYIRGIKHLFEETKQHILQKPAYRSFIEGSQAYTTYKGKQVPDPRAVADLDKKFTNMKIMQPAQAGVSQVVRPIRPSDLVSLQALQSWQKNNLPNMPLPNILQQVQKHLDDTDVSKGQS